MLYLSAMKNAQLRDIEPIEKIEVAEQPVEEPSRLKKLIKRFGVAGFLFFFIKGVVLYILIPLGLFKWFGGC